MGTFDVGGYTSPAKGGYTCFGGVHFPSRRWVRLLRWVHNIILRVANAMLTLGEGISAREFMYLGVGR